LAMVPARGTGPILTSLLLTATQAPIRLGRQQTGKNEMLCARVPGFYMGLNEVREADTNTSEKPHSCLTHVFHLRGPEERQSHESSSILEAIDIPYFRKKDEPRILPDPKMDQKARQRLRQHWAEEECIIVGMLYETTYPLKHWPLKHSLQLIELGLADRLRFVLFGLNDQHVSLTEKMFPKDRVLDLSGQTNLNEMISLISVCDVFFSADTGPAHIAQALGLPTVVLFGPSNEKEFGPIDKDLHALVVPPEDLPCRPCVLGPCVLDQTCMNSITSKFAYTSLKARLDLGRRQRKKREKNLAHPKHPLMLLEI